MLTRNFFVAGAAAVLLVGATALPAAALAADDFGPIVEFADSGYRPAIAAGPADGSALVVYAHYDRELDGDEIMGQFVSNEMEPIGAPFAVSTPGGDDSYNAPGVEWNADRQEWLVVWEQNTSESDVVAGRVVRPGVGSVGSEFVVAATYDGAGFTDLELAYAAFATDQDLYLVVFKATVNFDGECQAAFGVFVNSDGSVPSTAATLLSLATIGECTDDTQVDNGANVDYSPASSRWLVGWYYRSQDEAAVSVQNIAGVVTPGTPTLVGENTSSGHPTVTHDPSRDRFLLNWHHSTGANELLRGALVTPAGALIDTDFSISGSDSRGDQRVARVAYDPTADLFLMVNHNQANGDTDLERFVLLREMPASLGDPATNPEILSDPTVTAERPDIALAGDCVLVVWQWFAEGETEEDERWGVQGRSTCTTPELAATGATDGTGAVWLGALFALIVGGALVTARRARIADNA